MMTPTIHPSATHAWINMLKTIVNSGRIVSPRGMETLELLHLSTAFRMQQPVVVSPARKLSYRFMCAEALWILAGDNTVEGIAPYCKNIAQFSDNGETFFGAYGPRIAWQLGYIVETLHQDLSTRQAVLTIWIENPPASKDIPCTVSLTFNIREDELNCHVFMRSSDAWLGVPYDFFNFSMIALRVACSFNQAPITPVRLGTLHFTAVSSHLYSRNWEGANRVLAERRMPGFDGVDLAPIPRELITTRNWSRVEQALLDGRERALPPTWTT